MFFPRCLTIALCFLALGNVHAQVISYLTPDLGTPGLNTYIEIIGPNTMLGDFGTDGLYPNNPGDSVRVVCVNATDTNAVKFGPCIVSWQGRMISTQAFVMPWVQATSSDWSKGIKIPLRVIAKGLLSTVDTFYIVQPQTLGTLATPGLLGSGGAFGTRSRRGAMLVDSMVLTGAGTYGVSSADCDLMTPGNQGYLPLTLISVGAARANLNAVIDASGNGVDAGPGGGGGGNGLVCGTRGGDGFTGGGGNADWNSGCGDRPPGTGSGAAENGLNGTPGGVSSKANEGGGGGTGTPFGYGGAAGGAGQYGGGQAGYGGGAGGPQCCVPPVNGGGGGGGFATKGGEGGFVFGYVTGGYVNGNGELVPMSGGSGGGGGNVDDGIVGAGNGGGGGGAIAIAARTVAIASLHARGGIGADDTSGTPNGAGGGGSGGAILVGSKLSLSVPRVDVHSGSGGAGSPKNTGQDGGDGGSGRVRFDGPIVGSSIVIPPDASRYSGPSTDTSHEVTRTFTLTGTGNGKDIRLYVRPISGAWSRVATVSGYLSSWSQQITLPGNDTMYLLAAAQLVLAPDTGTYTAEPSWVLSQVGANYLHVTECSRPVVGIAPAGLVRFCAGQSRQIVASPSGLQYRWSKNGITLPVKSDTLSVSDSGSYSVVVSTLVGGCTDSASIHVEVDPLPVAAILQLGPVRLCPGDTAVVQVMPSGQSYHWTRNGTPLADTSATIHVSDSGVYLATVTTAAGCSDTASIAVKINAPPVAVITPPETAYRICEGSHVTLIASGGAFYRWSTGETSASITVAQSGAYSVKVIDTNGCAATSRVVAVATIPAADFALSGDTTITICADSGVAYVRHLRLVNHLATSQKLYLHQIGSGFHGVPDSLTLGALADTSLSDTIVTNGIPQEYSSKCYAQDSCGAKLDSATVALDARFAPSSLSIELLPTGSMRVSAGDTLGMRVDIHARSACISRVRVMLTYAGDILQLFAPDGGSVLLDSSTRIGDSTREYLTLLSTPDTGIISALTFRTFIAAQDSTAIRLTILSYDSTCLPCIASKRALGTAMSVVYGCGEDYIQQFVASGSFLVGRIVPNPASDRIEVQLAAQASDVSADLYDVLGRPHVLTTLTAASSAVLQFDVSGVPEGVYYLRLAWHGLVAMRRVEIAR